MNAGPWTPEDYPGLPEDVEAELRRRGGKGSPEMKIRCLYPDRHSHGDRDPSANYNTVKYTLHCHACGADGGLLDVARLLGLDPDTYRRNGAAVRPPSSRIALARPARTDTKGWTPSTEPPPDLIYPPARAWRICNARGELFGIHARFPADGVKALSDGTTKPDKTFRWWRNGRWSLGGLKGPAAPLYGSELLGDVPPDEVVVVTEGEGKADALRGIGLVAVGTATGASGTPGPEALDVLRGRRVVLFPDADANGGGYAHMERIAQALRGVAASVAMFTPAGLPEGGDAVEWIAARLPTWGDADLREQILREAVMVDGEAEPLPEAVKPAAQRAAQAFTLTELLALELPPPEPILTPWLNRREMAMVYSERGVGKSHLALGIGYAAATGGTFLRWHAPKPRKVLLIDGENLGTELQKRLRNIMRSDPRMADPEQRDRLAATAENFRFVPAMLQEGEPLHALDSPEGQAQVEPYLDGVELVIIDNLSTLTRSKENEADDWRLLVMPWLLDLRRRGVAVLFMHHAGKSGAQRGTSSREDALHTIIRLERPSDYKADEGARFSVIFTKSRGLHGAGVEPFEAALTAAPDGRAVWLDTNLERYRETRALEMLRLGMSPTDVMAALGEGVSKPTVYRWIDAFVADGRLDHDPRRGWGKKR